jgi:Replication-relaxation
MLYPAQTLPQQPPQPVRSSRKKKPREVVITSRYEEILQSVHQLRYVTALDIARLFYSPTSLNHVREQLSLLAGQKDYAQGHYLFRFPLPNTRIGNTEKIYTLGSKGRAYLQTQGMVVDWYFRPYKVASMTYQNCLHALTLTRFLVAAQVFCKKSQEWEVTKLQTEYELKKEIAEEKAKQHAATIALNTPKGEEAVTVIPDAWLQFHHPEKKHAWQPVMLEIDRGTEQQKFFKKHVRARLLFLANGGYKKLFGTNKGVIAYATTGNQTRLQSMRTWTHEVATELNLKPLGLRFRFCSLTPSWEQDEIRLFLAPLWCRALDKHPVPLLA